MGSRLLNFGEKPGSWEVNDQNHTFTVYGAQRPQTVNFGGGFAYFFYNYTQKEFPVWNGTFSLLQGSPIDYSAMEYGKATVTLDSTKVFPCAGLITHTLEGYLYAPTLHLKYSDGEVAIMLLSCKSATPLSTSTDNPVLTVPANEATVTLSGGYELRAVGSVSGGFKATRLVLKRRPRVSISTMGFDTTLFETNSAGGISATWKPSSGSFDDCALAFNPSKMGESSKFSIEDLGELLGFEPYDSETGKSEDTVIRDGGPVEYTLRLVVDHHLGLHHSDETRLQIA